jgi:hypothetical protein
MSDVTYGSAVIYGPRVIYGTYSYGIPATVEGAMQAQAPRGWEFFVCQTCRHWKGGCSCTKNCFITCTGANTSACSLYEIERRERNSR